MCCCYELHDNNDAAFVVFFQGGMCLLFVHVVESGPPFAVCSVLWDYHPVMMCQCPCALVGRVYLLEYPDAV